MINEVFITESIKEKEIIEMNNIIKDDDEILENFDNNYWNEEYIDEINLNMNNNNYDQLNEEFLNDIHLYINDNDNDYSNKEFK